MNPIQQPLLTACAPAVMRSEPFQGIGVALAQVAAGAGRNQVLPRRDTPTSQRANVVKRVSIGAAVGAVGAPVGEDPAPEPGLSFAFRHQLSPVDVVVWHAGQGRTRRYHPVPRPSTSQRLSQLRRL